MADATKAQGSTAWIQIPDTVTDSPSATTGSIDFGAGSVDEMLNIKIAPQDTNTTTAGSLTVRVEVLNENVSEWELHQTFTAGAGTATKEDIAAQSASGQPNIQVADTSDWDTGLGERLIIYDNADYTKSEIVEIKGWVDNDYYIAQDNLVNTHENTADLLNGVQEFNVVLPNGIRYARVNIHNSDDDANFIFKVGYSYVSEYV